MKANPHSPDVWQSRMIARHTVCRPAANRFDDVTAGRYEAIANDPKYQHFIRIPRRIIRCLEFFGINCPVAAVERRLRAYYLFIGVIDNAIDSGQTHAAQSVLRQLQSTPERFDDSTIVPDIVLATEGLKLEIADETSPELLRILCALSQAVEQERTARSITDYIEVRKHVGRLTARGSYVLMRPLLSGESAIICNFMERVGEIGCLVDSVIDLHADQRSGLLKFQSTPLDFIWLLTYTIKSGARFSISYPHLFGLFLEAVIDILRDRVRARNSDERRQILSKNVAATTT